MNEIGGKTYVSSVCCLFQKYVSFPIMIFSSIFRFVVLHFVYIALINFSVQSSVLEPSICENFRIVQAFIALFVILKLITLAANRICVKSRQCIIINYFILENQQTKK